MTSNEIAPTKFFTVVVEGATTDGRDVSRDWIMQMAQNYDPKVYCAQINIEHVRAYSPHSDFKRYGIVTALRTHTITDGALQGKLALQAQIQPTIELIELNKLKQKLFTSVEIAPEFADTKSAYLVGLAVTDDPASLGTEILQFSATAKKSPLAGRKQNSNNVFSASDIDFNLITLESEESFSNRINDLKHTIINLFNKAELNNSKDLTYSSFVQALARSITDLVAVNNDLLNKLAQQEIQINELLVFKEVIEQEISDQNCQNTRSFATGASFTSPQGY